jgi:hypothetical protein
MEYQRIPFFVQHVLLLLSFARMLLGTQIIFIVFVIFGVDAAVILASLLGLCVIAGVSTYLSFLVRFSSLLPPPAAWFFGRPLVVVVSVMTVTLARIPRVGHEISRSILYQSYKLSQPPHTRVTEITSNRKHIDFPQIRPA